MQERWRDGDGYLTASEIAALKLDADRVILSSGLLGTAYRLSVWCDFRLLVIGGLQHVANGSNRLQAD